MYKNLEGEGAIGKRQITRHGHLTAASLKEGRFCYRLTLRKDRLFLVQPVNLIRIDHEYNEY